MRKIFLTMLCLAIPCASALAGEIYGTIKEGGKPVKGGTKVEVKCAKGGYSAETDKLGSYRLFVPEQGKCTLSVLSIDGSPQMTLTRSRIPRGTTSSSRKRAESLPCGASEHGSPRKRISGTRRRSSSNRSAGCWLPWPWPDSVSSARNSSNDASPRRHVPGLHRVDQQTREADSALRKDMFVSIIQSFLRADSTSIDDRLLKLELLAYNFMSR